jgi:hypothetical protein
MGLPGLPANPAAQATSYRRIYFYMLKPPTEYTGDDPIPHPDATLPFIELALPGSWEACDFDIPRIILNARGKICVQIISGEGTFDFVGVWDWKKGLGLSVSITKGLTIKHELTHFSRLACSA